MEITGQILYQIANSFDFSIIWEVIVSFKWVFITMLIGYIIHWLPENTKVWYRHLFIKSPVYVKVLVVIVTVFGLYQSISADHVPFIYFQF